ncbi:MAG TPA: rod shape-determining protein MreC [Solirubrobacterales bacterium]|nr:rod shape-determining protein MreC [Solirubrobacterales bacterium]
MYRKQVRRRRAALTLLIIGSFLLLTATYGQGSGSLQQGIGTIFGPLQEGADRALKPARDLVGWFDETFEARGENDRLRSELERARLQAVAGQEALQENEQFRDLLELDRSSAIEFSTFEPVTGRVITRSPTVWHSAVTIDLGSGDGVAVDDPVVSGAGLVGQVSAVQPGSAQVTLITDHTSGVTAKVLPGGAQGVVRPDVGDPEDLVLDFIVSARKIGAGQPIVTAGWRASEITSWYPAGLPIGEVTQAPIVEQEASQRVHLRPYADLANLDFVQVLTGGARG